MKHISLIILFKLSYFNFYRKKYNCNDIENYFLTKF